ncbi:MAG TPA: preprotein translocase subunit YajC [Gemmatimonadales bacterium]|nr:preprotein translocase subunit YajC [Gemmatimonadales bacterium]
MTLPMLTLLAPAPGSPSGGMTILIGQIAVIIGIFYLFIIRPQGQARKRHAQLLAGLKKGDDVLTAGGIVGKVKDIKEVADKKEIRVTIESGTSTLVVERSRIIRVGDTSAPQA